jgi:hypothetical protein
MSFYELFLDLNNLPSPKSVFSIGKKKKIKIKWAPLLLFSLSCHITCLFLWKWAFLLFMKQWTVSVSEAFTVNYEGDYTVSPPSRDCSITLEGRADCTRSKHSPSSMLNCNATPRWHRSLSVSEFEFRTSGAIIFWHSRQEDRVYPKANILKGIHCTSPRFLTVGACGIAVGRGEAWTKFLFTSRNIWSFPFNDYGLLSLGKRFE